MLITRPRYTLVVAAAIVGAVAASCAPTPVGPPRSTTTTTTSTTTTTELPPACVDESLVTYRLRLVDAGLRPGDTIVAIKTLLGVGLREAQAVVDAAPADVAVGWSKSAAEMGKRELTDVGAVAEVLAEQLAC